MSGDTAIDGISTVLAAATAGNVTASIGDSLMGAGMSAPTVEDYLSSGAASMLEEQQAPKKKRGRPKGSRSRPTSPGPPDGMSGEDMTRAYITKLGEETATDKRSVQLKRKINKAFEYFPHKLSKYYAHIPNIAAMSVQQLIDLDQLVLSIIDDTDESYYVKAGFKMAASAIESVGPGVYRRFLRWMPGAEILQMQSGLSEAVEELVEVQGEEGLADDVNRVSLDFVGWLPNNPYFTTAIKLYQVMHRVRNDRIDEINNRPKVCDEQEAI